MTDNDLARRPGEHRMALLARLGASGPRTSTPPTAPRTEPLPLSAAQEQLWFIDRLAPGKSTYNVPVAYRLRGPLDVPALRGALQDLAERHETLRTSLHERDGEGVQRIHADVTIELPVTARPLPDALREGARLAAAPFDLSVAPLWRAALFATAPDEHLLVVVLHHIVSDGWSLEILERDLSAAYKARAGVGTAPAPLLSHYADYAIAQRERVHEDSVRYWTDRLADLPVVEFPPDRPRPSELTYRGRTLRRPLDPALAAAVTELSGSPYAVYLAAFAALLHRYTGQEDLVVGSPYANRGRAEAEPLIGYFVNMVTLRLAVAGTTTGTELLEQARDAARDAIAHGELPFDRVVDAVRPSRDPARTPLFGIGFGLLEDGAGLDLPGIAATTEPLDLETSRFDLSWNVVVGSEGARLFVEYSTDLYDEATVAALAGHYEELLRGLVAAPETTVASLPLLSAAERAELLERWDGPRRPIRSASIPEVFAEQVARDPQAVALVVGGEEITYADLDRRSNRLARLLVGRGVGRGQKVALCLPREADLVVAVLAVLKAGAAYVPVDPGNPPARMAAIFDDAAPALVLTATALADRLPEALAPLLLLDTLDTELAANDDAAMPTAAQSSDLAYVIYTSGTTGRPKGVLIEQHSVVSFIGSCRELFELTPADRVLGFASLNFDVSVFEIFGALLTGARLCLVRDDERLDTAALQRLLEATGVTVTDLPPPVMALLEPARLPALRIVFVGGEAFSADLVNRWNHVDGGARRLFNGYGPTECTVTMIVQECPGTWTATPPIGLPMVNHVAHVVDAGFGLVPYGVPGELVIGGEGLTPGYLNEPTLTADKLVDDPFGTAPGGRLYRTGDLVRRRRDGALVFLGRVDQQVKIRGLRVELGEIETALAAHPGVAQVAVAPWDDETGEKHLVAYVSPAGGAHLDVGELREHAGSLVPRYMVPAYVVVLDRLKLNASGKVDRRALPAPQEHDRGAVGGTPPSTETERVLAEEMIAGLLRLPRVGVHDNFFDLGGNSLQATRLVSRIRDHFGVEVQLAEFFRSPTAAHLATVIDAAVAESALTDEELLALISQLPADQVDRLLDISEG